jgi:hypothetical protein
MLIKGISRCSISKWPLTNIYPKFSHTGIEPVFRLSTLKFFGYPVWWQMPPTELLHICVSKFARIERASRVAMPVCYRYTTI